MKTAIAIVQNIILPKLEKDPKFSEEKVDTAFWEKFVTNLLHFEEDAKPIYATIYGLELENPEKIMDKLPTIYTPFLKELAESYVLGQTTTATDYLLEKKNEAFLQEVQFLQTMQQAIKSVERKRIKADLPKSYERLTFELSETDLANASKKKGREDLREKMREWDAVLEGQESVPVISMVNPEEEKSKVISLSWMKYAVAACVVLATGIFFFRNTNQDVVPTQNTVVTTDAQKDSVSTLKKTPVKEVVVLAEIETVSKKTTVLEEKSMGFSGAKKQNIIIVYQDARRRIASLEKYITNNSSTTDTDALAKYKSELIDLKKSNDNYIFDGKTLTLYGKFNPKQDAVLVIDYQNYFLKKGNTFYNLKTSKVVLPLEKVSNKATIETLEKIIFLNE